MLGSHTPCQTGSETLVYLACQVDACSGNAGAWLDQLQLGCPCDGRPAIRDVELTVDAFGVSADRAHGDHELTGDLRSG